MSSEPISDDEKAKRLEKARVNYEQNLLEFKRKKTIEIPCFRSTFLTSKSDC